MKRPVSDTTDFFSIDCGDEIQVGDRVFRITGHEWERRFGIEDPKFWVKRALDKATGERKIIKLAFFETFETTLGGVKIRCYRDPDKEAAILDMMKGNPCFMQGQSFRDEKGNNVRVLDIVRGSNFFVSINALDMDHRTYFDRVLPDVLRRLRGSFEAIRLLHRSGFRHGDIRNDHIIVDGGTGNYVWIDFDYDYHAPENPFSLDLFGLGNILLYAAGKGFHDFFMIKSDTGRYGDLIRRIDGDDFSILDKSRLLNLKKLYPYIPDSLNNILMHFSKAADVYYERIDEIIEDLERVEHD
jgi:hypothetical protein